MATGCASRASLRSSSAGVSPTFASAEAGRTGTSACLALQASTWEHSNIGTPGFPQTPQTCANLQFLPRGQTVPLRLKSKQILLPLGATELQPSRLALPFFPLPLPLPLSSRFFGCFFGGGFGVSWYWSKDAFGAPEQAG